MSFEDFDVYEMLRMFRRRYVLALCAVALLALSAFGANCSVIQNHREDGVRINIAGRQRMLSQRMALFATMIHSKAPEARSEDLRAELETMRQLFERSHRALLEGDAGLGLTPREQDAHFTALYFGERALDRRVKEYLKDVDAVLDGPDDAVLTQAQLERLHAHAMALLPLLDAATVMHEQDSVSRANMLFWLEVLILAMMWGMLALEAILIFEPMDRVMHRQLHVIREEGIAAELASRRMKILLDVTGQGVVTLTHDGCFGEVYNHQFEQWFGPVVEGEPAVDMIFAQSDICEEVHELFRVHGTRHHLIALAASMPKSLEFGELSFSMRTHYTYEPEQRLMLILADETSARDMSEVHETLLAKEQLFGTMLQSMLYPLSAIQAQAQQVYEQVDQERMRRCAANIMVLSTQLLMSTDDPVQLSDMKAGNLVCLPSVFVLEELVEEVVRVIKPATVLQHNTIQTLIEPGLSTLCTDRVKMFHLLIHILSGFNELIDHGILRVVMRTQNRCGQPRLVCELICQNRQSYAGVTKKEQVWNQMFAGQQANARAQDMVLTQKLCQALGGQLFERSNDAKVVCYRLVLPMNPHFSALHVVPEQDDMVLEVSG